MNSIAKRKTGGITHLVLVSCLAKFMFALPSGAAVEYPSANPSHPGLSSSEPVVSRLTPEARELADLGGITSLLQELENEQKAINAAGKDKAISLPVLARRQKLIYIREKLNTMIQAINLQINSTKGKIDSEIAKADELRAYLTEQRNRVTHRNSQINLISGGITKIVGYSIALSPLTDIPTNVLEVFDGSVQTGLSGLALREERREAKLEHGMPGILNEFMSSTSSSSSVHFPTLIWGYLNQAPLAEPAAAGAKLSRRQQLITNWQKNGITSRASGQQKAGRVLVTVDLLDQRMAMLTDVNSLVAHLHSALMLLSQSLVSSYAQDPEF